MKDANREKHWRGGKTVSLNDDVRRSIEEGSHIPEMRAEIVRLKTALVNELQRGFCMAASQVQRSHDEPGIAYELMKSVGVTTHKECRDLGLDEFDLKPLYAVLKSENRSRKP